MEVATVSKGKLITGWVITGLVSALFLFGAVASFLHSPQTIDSTAKMGYDASKLPLFGCIMLLCAAFYLIPSTSVLGAVLFTAYLGGAVATHIRIGDGMVAFPILFCGFVWLGIYLREPRIRAILPLRR